MPAVLIGQSRGGLALRADWLAPALSWLGWALAVLVPIYLLVMQKRQGLPTTVFK